MPNPDDATISLLLDALRQDTERSQAAWLQLREILRAEPARGAARLCTWLDECLASGATIPVQASIIPAVRACTKHQPDLIPEDVVRRLLSRAEQFDGLSLLCLAAMLARLRPEGIITQGIFQVLVATERALVEPENESEREVQRSAKKIALELWRTVAARDPASLVALLQGWAAQAGWQGHSNHLLAELLLEAAPLHPNILGDTIAVLEALQAQEQQSPGELEPPDRILNELQKLGETLQHKTIAEGIASEVLSALPPPKPIPSAPCLRDKSAVAPDLKVDRLIEEYVAFPDYMERLEEAERRIAKARQSNSMDDVREEDIILARSEPPRPQLTRALSEPYLALVEGVCELVDELIAADPMDKRIGMLVVQLCLGLYKYPNLIPVDKFQRWVTKDTVFDYKTKAWLYGRLATVCPDWIIEHRLADAVSVSIVDKASNFFSDIGVCYPEFLRGFVERYLSEVAYNWVTARELMGAIETVARQRPEEAEAMIAVIERLRGGPHEPDVIDFRYTELSKTLDLLRNMEGKDKP